MLPPETIVTNFPRAQILGAIDDLERSIEANREQISLFQILTERLSATSAISRDGGDIPVAAGFLLREKDQVRQTLVGLIQGEYDQINGKHEVIAFLERLLPYSS